jgi:hypothetical protein
MIETLWRDIDTLEPASADAWPTRSTFSLPG